MSAPTCNKFDVICGRGRSAYLHAGNKRFRRVVEHHIVAYNKASSRQEKSSVVSSIIDAVQSDGDFVRELPDGSWERVNNRMVREKCGQGLRDFLHRKYRSSTQAKQAKRKLNLEEESVQMMDTIQSNAEIRSVLSQLKTDLKAKASSSDSTSTSAAPTIHTVQAMFDTANSQILEELKAIPLLTVAQQPPVPSDVNPSTMPTLARKVTDEHEPRYPQLQGSSSSGSGELPHVISPVEL